MQIITRTIAILLAALLIVGATIGLNQAGLLAGLSAQGGPPQAQQTAAGSAADTDTDTADAAGSGRPAGRPEGGHDEGGAGLIGLVSVGKNLGVMSIIVAAVALLGQITRRWTGRRERATGGV